MSLVPVHGPTMLGRVTLPGAADTTNLASLKADLTYGDGAYTGNTGDYTILDDGSRAEWNGTAWVNKDA